MIELSNKKMLIVSILIVFLVLIIILRKRKKVDILDENLIKDTRLPMDTDSEPECSACPR